MKKQLVFFLLIGGILSGCQSKEKADTRRMVGEWVNTELNMLMPTYQKGQSTFRLEAKEDNYGEVMDMNPSHMFFQPDGTFRQEYRNHEEYPFAVHGGRWEVSGGKLHVYQQMPFPDTSHYLYSFRGADTMVWETTRDYDLDGAADDYYQAIQVRAK